jgi:4-hydroxythreonine-4-phosphate dehydrogenase
MPISQLNKKVIVITSGDPAGIGPEMIIKSLSSLKAPNLRFLIIGDKTVFDNVKKRLRKKTKNICNYNIIKKADLSSLKSQVNLLDLNIIGKRKYVLGKASKLCARASAEYILTADKIIKKKIARALVTAPINKDALNSAGYKWSGHTEVLAKLARINNFAMSFVAGHLKIVLVTTHLPLMQVSRNLKTRDILKKIKLLNNFLKKYYKIKRPNIGVCGLNPHASDAGLFGDEERKIILPAVKGALKENIAACGPTSAEKLFYDAYRKKVDGLVAMYHDQALIALKMVLRDQAVNVTLGLPYIRTSCSSGTAYDIAPKFIADETTMKEAIKLAAKLIS